MTLPPHIANAPTPRTDAVDIRFKEGDSATVNETLHQLIENSRQLEHQLIWLTEVVEKHGINCDCLYSPYDEQGEILWGGKRLVQQCNGCIALNEYKQGTKEV